MLEKREQNKPQAPEDVLAQRSKIARERMAVNLDHDQHKSKFDYLSITMAWLMAIITIAGIAIGAMTVLR